jgi:tetratricopeptide (TPR) repeat protein
MKNDASANYWKLKGNNCFDKANYHVAVNCYSKALGSSPTLEEAITIKLNRALTYLKTHQFDAALRDLQIASTGFKPSEKALFRKAQALYYLQRFREACDAHQVLAKEFPNNALRASSIAPLRDSRNKRAASISSHDCSSRRKNVAHQFLIMRPTLVLWL